MTSKPSQPRVPQEWRIALPRSLPGGVMVLDVTLPGLTQWIVGEIDRSITGKELPQYQDRGSRRWGDETTPLVLWQIVTESGGSVGLLEVAARSEGLEDVAAAMAWFETLDRVVRRIPSVMIQVLERPGETVSVAALHLAVSQRPDRTLQIRRAAA